MVGVALCLAAGCAALMPPPDVTITCQDDLPRLSVAECNRVGRFALANAPAVIARTATEVEVKPARVPPGRGPEQYKAVQIWANSEMTWQIQVTILPDGRLWTYTPGATPP